MSTAKQRRYQAKQAFIELLAAAYPNCFYVYEPRRRPLKIGIYDDLKKQVPNRALLSGALQVYCSSAAYRKRLKVGAQRIDLEGNPSGVVSADEVPPKPKPEPPAEPPKPKRIGLEELRALDRARKAAQQ